MLAAQQLVQRWATNGKMKYDGEANMQLRGGRYPYLGSFDALL